MKLHITILLCALLSILSGCSVALCEYHVDYIIRIGIDGSAEWVVEERFLTGESPPPSSQLFEAFISNVTLLVDSAEAKSGREMTVSGFAMTANVSGSYTFVKYRLLWAGFAAVGNDSIRIGDVFEVEGLFLFSEGSVSILYPSGYVVRSVSPRPLDQSPLTLTWWGIEDFNSGEPNLVLVEGETSFWDTVKDNAMAIASIIAIATLASMGLYFFKTKRTADKKEQPVEQPAILEGSMIEDDEEKIVSILKAANGHLHQAAIATQCRFSKAKTSLLLREMEQRGIVTRRERGREKIVTLVERSGEGETQT